MISEVLTTEPGGETRMTHLSVAKQLIWPESILLFFLFAFNWLIKIE